MTDSRLTRHEITECVRELRETGIGLESYRNCGAINNEIRNYLMETYPELTINRREVIIRYTPRSAAGDEHVLLEIPAGELEDVSASLYVDGALDQFCKENKERGLIGATLPAQSGDGIARRSEFECVEVFTQYEKRGWTGYMAGL